MLKNFLIKFWPLPLISAAVFVFFVRLIYPQLSVFVIPDFGTSDLLNFNYPFRDFLGQSLKVGQLPLWTNLIGSGFPFLAEGQAGTFFFINAIASFLPNVAWGMAFSYLAYFLLMGFGMYLFTKELGLGKWEALFGALVFTFSGVNLTHLSHPNQLAVVSLIPLQFFLLEKFLKGSTFARWNLRELLKSSSWLAFFSLVTAQSIFAGYLQPTVYAILALGVYFCLRLIFSWKVPPSQGGTFIRLNLGVLANLGGFLWAWLRPITLFVLSLVLAVGLSAIQFLPSWELSQQSSRQGGLPESILKLYPYPPKNLLTFLNPNWFGTPKNGSYPMFSDDWGIYWENTGYVGLIPLGLALLVVTLFFFRTAAFLLKKFQIPNSKSQINSNNQTPSTNEEPNSNNQTTFLKFGHLNLFENCKLKISSFSIFLRSKREQIENLITPDDRKTIVIFIFLLLVSLLLTLGKYTPLFALYHWPPLSYFRVPSRWLIIVDFSLSVLAGFGLKILMNLLKGRTFLRPASANASAGLGFTLKVRPFVSSFPLSYLLAPIFCFIVLFDLWFYFFNFNPIGSYQKWIQTPAQIVEFLKSLPVDQAGQNSGFRYYEVGSTIAWNATFVDKGWQDNLDSFWKLREGARPSNNILYNLPSAGIYAGLLPKRQSDIINLTDALFVAQPDGNLAVTNAAITLLSIQNVKYVVSPFSLLHSDLKPLVSTRFSAPDINFIVYENLKVMPHAYLVDHFRLSFVGGKISNDLEMVKKQLVSPDFNPREAIILEEDPKFNRAGSLDNSSVTIINNSNEKVQLKVNIPSGNGLLVLADSYYPGWVAKVDGNEAKILAANLNQRAISVPQGEHSVEFFYQPLSFKIGAVISFLSLIVLISWFLVAIFSGLHPASSQGATLPKSLQSLE